MRTVFALLAALSLSAFAGEETLLWPQGRVPDFQAHQFARPSVEWMGPEKPTTDSCLLLITGGAYLSCGKSKWIVRVAERYMAKGVTCYRLIYRHPRPRGMPIWKTAVQDGQRAVRIVRGEAKRRGFDPHKLAVFGFSAGGNLAQTLATSSETAFYEPVDELDRLSAAPDLAVPVYAAYTLDDGLLAPNERGGVGRGIRLSDQFRFDAQTPPVCLFHGGADEYSPNGSTATYLELLRRGLPAELHLYADGGHVFFSGAVPGDGGDRYLDRLDEWFAKRGFLPSAADPSVVRGGTPSRGEREDLWTTNAIPHAVGGERPTLTWFAPAKRTTRAVALVVADEGEAIARACAARGLTSVLLTGRTRHPDGLPKSVAARADATRAIRVVRAACAAKGLDAASVGLIGVGDGGHLALLCATSSKMRAYLPQDALDQMPATLDWAVPVAPTDVLEPDGRISEDFGFDLATPRMCLVGRAGEAGFVKVWERLRRMGVQCDLHASEGFDKSAPERWLTPVGEWLVHICVQEAVPRASKQRNAR